MHELSEATIEAFHDSLERCGNASEFLGDFYHHFMASSPAIAAKFADTNFKAQTRMLKTSFYMSMLASDQHSEARDYLDRIAKRHNHKDLNINPEYYDIWLDSMLIAVREHDPLFNESIEEVWRSVMQPAIAYMKSLY